MAKLQGQLMQKEADLAEAERELSVREVEIRAAQSRGETTLPRMVSPPRS